MSCPGLTGLLLILTIVSSSLPDAFNVAPIFEDAEPKVTTTRTVFGFHDYVTTVDNTVMVFTPDANGVAHSLSPVKNSQAPGSPSIGLEQLFGEQLFGELQEEKSHQPFIEVQGGGQAKTQDIQPSRVAEQTEDHLENQEIIIEEPLTSEQHVLSEEANNDVIDEEVTTLPPATTPRAIRLIQNKRKSAALSYKERLKQRFKKEKAKLALKDLTRNKPESRSHLKFTPEREEQQTAASTYRARAPRARSFRSRHHEAESKDKDDQEEVETDKPREGRSLNGFGSRSRTRPSRRQSSSSRPSFSRTRTTQAKHKIRESIREQTSGGTSSKFTPAKKSSFGSRERHTSRGSHESPSKSETIEESPTEKPQKSQNPNTPKIMFKKFDRFSRPNIKKTLYRNKLFDRRPGLQILKGNEKKEVEFPDDHDSSPSALVIETINDEDILQNIDNDEYRFSRLQTTLHVSTVYPEETPDQFVEVATIRSPYTFNIEEDQKSTRFITVTRTSTKSLDITPSSVLTSYLGAASSIHPTPSSALKHTPLFDTASIPAPENILASSPSHHDLAIEDSSDIEILPSLVLASSDHYATPPLETVTESFTTKEVIIKKSILPVVMGTDTSFLTLSQTFSITKMVTAIKTIPPMELYEFSPEHSFADFDNLFEEAGSENRESRLPGELEFSDQDNFGLEGPTLIKVAPPHGFQGDDLDRDKNDLIHMMEKHNNPSLHELKHPPSLESSFLPSSPSQQAPGFDLASLGGLGVTPEQLLYLQLLQNPLAALGLGKQVVTESSPIYKTEPVIESSVIKIILGAKEILTTLVSTVGFTTKTDYVLSTRTVAGGGLGGLSGALGGLQQSPNRRLGGLGGLLGAPVKIITSPVTRDTVITETNTEEFKVMFRNRPTYTTLTSTTLVTTQVVSYVTQTVTSNPLAGFLG